jgi:methylenetetrahydrofolate dehydrogenase (NADP+) / methenyltetrahydrofolate cyclohydrolase
MPAAIIDGTAIAEKVRTQVSRGVAALAERNRRVRLAALLVGGTPAGQLYAERQGQACKVVGIDYELVTLPATTDQAKVLATIDRLNIERAITGIMLHLPLPDHLDTTALQYRIDPVKDVEGVNPANIGHVVYGRTLIAPCTALAVLELIRSTGVPLRGAEATVVGASEIAGKPISLLLAQQLATVTLCHAATRDLRQHTRRAEVLVVAVGNARMIGADDVRDGAVIIDVGINRVRDAQGTMSTVGDVDFDAVRPKAAFITPVPGGVGPMTVAMLLKNTLRSAELASSRN